MNHYPSNLTDNQWQVIESPLLSKRIIFTFKTNFFFTKSIKNQQKMITFAYFLKRKNGESGKNR